MSAWTKQQGQFRIDIDALAKHLTSRGLIVVVTPGAQDRANTDNAGRNGWVAQPTGLLAHHTATSDSIAGDYPSLRVVRDGRAGLPGPLAQIGLGRSGIVYLIASGLAWHAGTVIDGAYDNWHAVGIEAEDDGLDQVYPQIWYASYARLCAALMEPSGLDLKTLKGHKEVAHPPGRKVDPVFDMDAFRDAVAKAGGADPEPAPSAPPKPKENGDMADTTSGAPLWNGRRMGTVCSYANHKKAGQEIKALGFNVKESNDFKPLDSNAHSSWRKGGWHYAYNGTGAYDINWTREGANSWVETMLIDIYVFPILRKYGVKGIIHKPRNRSDHKTWCHADRGSYNDYTVRTYTSAQKKQAAALIAKYRTGGGGGSAPKPTVTVLRYGDKGAAVKTLQRQLNQVGGAVTVDGSYGKATLATVKAYQKREGLKVDGIAGPGTQAKLASQQPKPIAVDGSLGPATWAAWRRWYGVKTNRECIKKVQASLNRQHGWNLDVDGSLGPNTIEALQIHYGTPADGKTSEDSLWVRALQKTLNRGK